jgi:hypothetical protein
MINLQNREWVVKALTFWENAKPNKFANRALIKWNIEQLSKALAKINQEHKDVPKVIQGEVLKATITPVPRPLTK